MKKVFVIMLLAAVTMGCTTSVSYTNVRNYFFRNDASIPDVPLIETQERFDSLFGAAAFMGKDGKPTEIDFERQSVIAVVLPVTENETTLKVKSIESDGGKVFFNYEKKVGERRTYSIQPVLAVAVEKESVAGKTIVLNETEIK